jgi:hypothetical protein
LCAHSSRAFSRDWLKQAARLLKASVGKWKKSPPVDRSYRMPCVLS